MAHTGSVESEGPHITKIIQVLPIRSRLNEALDLYMRRRVGPFSIGPKPSLQKRVLSLKILAWSPVIS